MSDQPTGDGGIPAGPKAAPPVPEPPTASAADRPWRARRRERGGGVFLGVLLIFVGTVFLLTQFVPGVYIPWWALWPIFIVVAGAVQLFTPGSEGWGIERVMEGLGTMLFGLVLLGNTTGYISWTVWWVFITLWPALVIALGLAILGKGLGQSWVRIVATLVVWVTLLYAVSASWTGAGAPQHSAGVWMRTGGAPFAYTEPVGGTKTAKLTLRGGAGELGISEGRELVKVTGTSPFGSPSFATKRSGDSAAIDIGLGNPDKGVVVMPGMMGSRMDVRLSGDVLWDATLETGATTLDADLSKVGVRDLEIKTGASSVIVKLGEVPSGTETSNLLVRAGVSSVTVLVPRDAAVRIEAKNGLAVTDVRGRFNRVGDVWQSAGYSSASKSWNIQTESGIGSVAIDTY